MAESSEVSVVSCSVGEEESMSFTTRPPRPSRPPPPRTNCIIPSTTASNSTSTAEEPTFLPPDQFEPDTFPADDPPPYAPPTEAVPPYVPPSTLYASTSSGSVVPHDVEPLAASQVRWFYKEPNYYWKPLSGHDSLLLERHYQTLKTGSGNGDPTVRVLGDMYDANLQEMNLEAVFWKSPKQPILRGTWFEVTSEKKWYPLETGEADTVEQAHCDRSWRVRADTALQAISEAGQIGQTGKVEWNKVFLKSHNVIWYGDQEVFMIKTNFSAKVLQKIGLSGRNKLMRGYKDPALFEDGRQPPVQHFVFCIHGIGQCYGDSTDDCKSVVRTTLELKGVCSDCAGKHFREEWGGGRVEFVPLEWRSMLTLDRGLVDVITPQHVKQLRDMANSTILDVIYYLSPVFHPEIIESVRFQLNKNFLHIMDRFPDFTNNGGKFSIFAHSLGSVIVYDILAECKPESEDVDGPDLEENDALEIQLAKARARVFELEGKMAAVGRHTRNNRKKVGLKFPVDHFFAVGSPLGVFLAMRDAEKHVSQDHRSAQDLLPFAVCKRVHNIYHASDCVAYRLEPLLSPVYQQVKPVKMDSWSSGVSQDMADRASGPRPQDSIAKKSTGFLSSIFGSKSATTVTKAPPPDKIVVDDSTLLPDSRLKERLDFCLKESTVQNSYLSVIFAHNGYWSNQDVALYLLCQIYNYKKL